MSRELDIQRRLHEIARQLKSCGLWQTAAPDEQAFASTEPFCVDTMTPLQWLQWVFLPRMQSLLDAGAPLPNALAIAPYYEVSLESDIPQRDLLLQSLAALDRLFEPGV